jgi:uncharacterized protein with GYD domain
MTFDYAKAAATALRLLEQFGQTVTRNASTAGTYDPATGASVVTDTSSSRTGVLLDYSGKGEMYANGNLVIQGDKKLLLDGSGAVEMTDSYVVGSTEYSVVSIKELNPGGTVVMFEIHVRAS